MFRVWDEASDQISRAFQNEETTEESTRALERIAPNNGV